MLLRLFLIFMSEKFEIIDGIKCYAPSLAQTNDGFEEDSFEALYKVEDKNFWFKSRNQMIGLLTKRYCQDIQIQSFLEIGCGTGYVLKELSQNVNLSLTGSEIYVKGLTYARLRNPSINFIQMDAREMPFQNEFHCVGAFDVLEHITEDREVMHNVFQALKPGGHFFITVPQYPFMWSHLDDMACHKRRYTKSELLKKLKAEGFECKYIGSFIFSLFPFMVISRYLKKNERSASYELKLSPRLNSIFMMITQVDIFLIKIGVRLPFGGSIVCVATKPSLQ